MAEFKPCPFCGEEPKVEITNCIASTIHVYCGNIKCPMTTVEICIEGTDVGKAMKHWNTRAEEDKQSEIEETANWDINCDGFYPFCSNCKRTPTAHNLTRYCPNCGRRMVTPERRKK